MVRIDREKVFYIPLDNKYYGSLQRAAFAKLFGKVLNTPKPRRLGAQLTQFLCGSFLVFSSKSFLEV